MRLASLQGEKVVIFFYPRDNTPGCTKESSAFAQAHQSFTELGFVVFGISTDSIASHEKFKAKLELPFELLSDEAGVVAKKYGCMKVKNMYGREFLGIERSTFLIDGSGILCSEWRKVKVAGHVEDVLQAAKNLA